MRLVRKMQAVSMPTYVINDMRYVCIWLFMLWVNYLSLPICKYLVIVLRHCCIATKKKLVGKRYIDPPRNFVSSSTPYYNISIEF